MYQFAKIQKAYEEIATGNSVKLTDEGQSDFRPMYIKFPFFGKVFDKVIIGANGVLSLVEMLPGSSGFYPETDRDGKLIWPQRFDYALFPLFGDLNPTPG